MMLFKNHKKGFILQEVVIALAVVGIMLTTVLELQLNVSQRIIFNTQTCHNFLELKKDLYHLLMKSDEKEEEQKSSVKKISITALEKYKQITIYKITRAWQSLRYQKNVELFFITVAPEKKDEK
jgi:hypothetical protein